MTAATAPRMGSRTLNKTRMKVRRYFTAPDYRTAFLCLQHGGSSTSFARPIRMATGDASETLVVAAATVLTCTRNKSHALAWQLR